MPFLTLFECMERTIQTVLLVDVDDEYLTDFDPKDMRDLFRVVQQVGARFIYILVDGHEHCFGIIDPVVGTVTPCPVHPFKTPERR